MAQAQIVQKDALEQSSQANFLHQEERQLNGRQQQLEKTAKFLGSKFLGNNSTEVTGVDLITGHKKASVAVATQVAEDLSATQNNMVWTSTFTGKKGRRRDADSWWSRENVTNREKRNPLGMIMTGGEKRQDYKTALKNGEVPPAGSPEAKLLQQLSYSDVNLTSMSVTSIIAGIKYDSSQTKRELGDIQDIRYVNPTTANLIHGAQQGEAKAGEILETKSMAGDEKALQAEEILAQQSKARGHAPSPHVH